MKNLIVGTGWYCATPRGEEREWRRDDVRRNRWWATYPGHPYTRSVAFHEIWKAMLHRHVSARIITVDSDSPIRLPPPAGPAYLRLNANYQHRGLIYDGWLRGFVVGAAWAWANDCDYLYVEQDVLVSGRGWLEAIRDKSAGLNHQCMLCGTTRGRFGGKWRSLAWPLQQCLVYVPHGIIARLIGGLGAGHRLPPERQFATAGVDWDYLPFGQGRLRPVDWGAEHLYLHHMTRDEVLDIAEREGLREMAEKHLSEYKTQT